MPKKAVFIHIQKTAGSSLVNLAKHQYGQSVVSSHADFYNGYCDEKAFISGHFGTHYARRYLGNRFAFTFLRDPIDRIISLYNFCRMRDPKQFPIYAAAHTNDFEGFVAKCAARPPKNSANEAIILYETLWNNMTWQLAYGWSHDVLDVSRATLLDFSEAELLERATDTLARLDYVGFHHSFNDDASHICNSLEMHFENIPHVNSSDKLIWRRNLSEANLAAVTGATMLDAQIYEIASTIRAGHFKGGGSRSNGRHSKRDACITENDQHN